MNEAPKPSLDTHVYQEAQAGEGPALPPVPQDPELPKKGGKFDVKKIASSIGKGTSQKRLLVQIGIGAFVLLLLISVLSLVVSAIGGLVNRENAPPEVTIATPGPVTTPEPQGIKNPSPYVSDPEVLSIFEETAELEQAITEIELREELLNVPRFNWDVDFK